MRFRTLLVLVLLALGLIGLALWRNAGVPGLDDIEAMLTDQGVGAASRLAALQRAAATGDPRDQFRLAEAYRAGRDVDRRPAAAAKWYREAARQGHLEAQYRLGRMYETGEGVDEDPYRAVEWYRLAARLGRHLDSQYRLGQMYFRGLGVPHSYAEATRWFRIAAERGHPVAQFLLGAMLAEGWGLEPDHVEALKWYRLAARQAERIRAESPRYDLDGAIARLLGQMTAFQISRANQRLAAWRPKS